MPVRVEFFEVSAQVLPVLFFAFVLEKRFSPKRPKSGEFQSDQVWRSIVLAALVVGETVALGTTATGQPTGLGVAVLILTYIAASSQVHYSFVPRAEEEMPRQERVYRFIITLASMVFVGYGAFWLLDYMR